MSEQFKIAGIDGFCEIVHLIAGVIDIIFALDVITGGAKNIDDSGTSRRASAVPDVQKSGWIRADVFNLNRDIVFSRQISEVFARVVNFFQLAINNVAFQIKIHEARAGNFNSVENINAVLVK